MDPEEKEINPYAAPAAIEERVTGPLPTDAVSKYGPYRDNRKLAAWLVGLLVFGIVINLLRGALNLAYTLTDFGTDEKLVTTIEGIMKGTVLITLTTTIVFGTWIVRSAKNGWLFAEVTRVQSRLGFHVKQAYLSDAPGWAVGWYFIPIASLWKPYAAMRDIVSASTVQHGPPGFLLPTWWTLWIVSNLSANAGGFLNSPSMMESVGFKASAWTVLAAIKVALHIVAIVLVRSITTLQTDTVTAMAEAPPADLPQS
jgi:hypothetical protein